MRTADHGDVFADESWILPVPDIGRGWSGPSSSEFSRNPNSFAAHMRVAFGECEFDSGRHVLLRHGSVRPLSPKAFQLLEVLLDRRPEAVRRRSSSSICGRNVRLRREPAQPGRGNARCARRHATERRDTSGPSRDTAMRSTVMRGRRPRSCSSSLAASRSAPHLKARSGFSRRVQTWLAAIATVPSASIRPGVSRRHARIVVTSGEATVEDLGSKNGTHVNGQLVKQPVALEDGARIRFGSVTMTYRILDTLPSTMTRRM